MPALLLDGRTGKKYIKKITSSLNHHVVADVCLLEGAILPEPRTSLERIYLASKPPYYLLPPLNNFLLGINNRDRVDRWVFNSDGADVVPGLHIKWGDDTWADNKNYCAIMHGDNFTYFLPDHIEEKLVYPIPCDDDMIQGKQAFCEKNEGIFFSFLKLTFLSDTANLFYQSPQKSIMSLRF